MRRSQGKRRHAAKPRGKVLLPEPTILEERRQQNLKAPVSQLPPELVLLVLSHFKDTSITAEKGGPGLDLLILTQVYHLWRDIALAAPDLWTDIHISMLDTKCALEMMHRSGESPLNVQAYFHGATPSILARNTRATTDVNKALAVMKENLWRCQELSLFAIYDVSLPDFLPRWNESALLNTLRLDIVIESTNFTLNDEVLQAESLRRLYVANSPVDWNARFLRQLTHLTLSAGRRHFHHLKPPLSGLLSAIPEMPHLEYLDFDDYFHSSNTTAKQVQHPALNLKELRLHLSIDDAASVLSQLTLLSTTNLYLSAKDTTQNLTPFHAILNSLTAIFNRESPLSVSTRREGHPHSFRVCKLSAFFETGYRIQAFREPFSSGLHPSLDCAFRWPNHVQVDDLPILDPLIAALPLDRIVELQIIGKLPFTSKSWAQKFGSIKTLQSISLGHRASISIFEGLVHDMGESTPQITKQPSPPPFPALTSISISSIDKVTMDRVSWSLSVDDWCKHLLLRVSIGFPLRQLTLVECPPLLDRQITLLKEVVGEVVETNEAIDSFKIIYGHGGDFENEFDWV